MTRPTRGIPTTYKGTLFRSRLEARWAAMFDQLQWAWTYEPFDAAGYIPDFAILGDRPLLVEVKPHITEAELERYVPRVCEATPHDLWPHDILIVGGHYQLAEHYEPQPQGRPYRRGEDGQQPVAGILIERWTIEDDDGSELKEDTITLAIWVRCCLGGGKIAVQSDWSSYKSRPCGHYNGSHGDSPAEAGIDLAAMWARATNAVRWEPRR